MYTLANNVAATPGPLGVARLYFHVLAYRGQPRGTRSCPSVELFADAVVLLTLGDRYPEFRFTYWAGMLHHNQGHCDRAGSGSRQERALQDRCRPGSADTYNDSDGNPDLARVWRDVKAIWAGHGVR